MDACVQSGQHELGARGWPVAGGQAGRPTGGGAGGARALAELARAAQPSTINKLSGQSAS